MSGVLLDTHVAIWLVSEPSRLGARCRALLASHDAHVSAASLWEAQITIGLGKLRVDVDLAAAFLEAGLRELPVRIAHTAAYAEVTLDHRDPFDRMLVAQARSEGLLLLTADRRLLGAGWRFVRDAGR